MRGEQSPPAYERKAVMTINRNTKIGKMIDNKRVVYQCLKCDGKFIGDADTNISKCPFCRWTNKIVIVENLVVVKGV